MPILTNTTFLPIESLFERIAEEMIYAYSINAPLIDAQLLNATMAAVATSGIFIYDIKLWKKKTTVDKAF